MFLPFFQFQKIDRSIDSTIANVSTEMLRDNYPGCNFFVEEENKSGGNPYQLLHVIHPETGPVAAFVLPRVDRN